MSTTSSLATAMRYRDVAAAADWLCAAFGFERQTVAADETGAILYAQLTVGNAMLMLAPVRDTTLDKFMKQPDEIGGAETQSCYFVVDDAVAHYARAKAAGAEIILDMQSDDFGGRGYSCRDPEGHIWSFGTYDPWQGKRPLNRPSQPGASRGMKGRVVLVGLVTIAALAAAVAWLGGALKQPSAVSSTVHVQEQPAQERIAAEPEQRASEAAERAVREAREQLDRERSARAAVEKVNDEALKRVGEEQRAREAAERAAREAREQLERERAAKATGEFASESAQSRAAEEQRAKEAAERAAQIAEHALRQAQQRVAEAQNARQAAERAAQGAREQLEHERAVKAAGEQANADVQKRVTEAQLAREAAERAAESAKQALEQAQKRVAEEQGAREAAERAAREAREQLTREQSAKNAAWRAAAQLRRQLGQAQTTNESSETSSTDDSAAPATKQARPRPKRQQKKAAKGPDE